MIHSEVTLGLLIRRLTEVGNSVNLHARSHGQEVGRDIALRCPRPRISGRNDGDATRGADGAARHPYQFVVP
jgi:hypothetical protein